MERDLIKNKDIPIRWYNYSYIKDLLAQKYGQQVSLPTIIDRAKRNNFYFSKPERKAHDREVLTNYPGELIQHDSSHHLFALYAESKWYLITSLDDYSRLILYAVLVERETAWEHILALESVFLKYGIPLAYYVDSHSIFRFVQGRDSFWRNHYQLTDEANPLESGVLVEVRPPGKKVSHMGLLSGGEKALVAMALLFAIYLIKPSPFCLLDEVDAPLDEANVDRFNDLLKEIRKYSQVLMITHNRRSMEIVDSLFGVTMENAGVSKMVAVNLNGNINN